MERTGKVVIAAALGLALGGCSTTWEYVGPGQFSQDQWNQDTYECQRDAAMLPKTQQTISYSKGIPTYSDPSLGNDIAAQSVLRDRCMRAKGYVPK
jgi:hypothetical protein